jgi:hypothetical protein
VEKDGIDGADNDSDEDGKDVRLGPSNFKGAT